jgi:hypothetical protein
MRRSSFFLAGIMMCQFGFAALGEVRYWLWFPEGDIPKWYQVAMKCYWLSVVGLLYFWCRADAKGRQLAITVTTSILVPLLFPIGVPFYYLRTYPTRSALIHIGLAVIFVALCVAAFWLGRTLMFDYYAIWTNHPKY